jgi:GNAT superfamily N-acetyltransferase
MLSITRLQAYLRHNARKQYEAVSVPPFTLFFHPHDALTFFNYAIPDEAIGGQTQHSGSLEDSLTKLRETFLSRGRQPRFEFIEEFSPDLAPVLNQAGFFEEERQQGMICLPDTFQPAPDVVGLAVTRLTRTSPVSEMQDFVTVQRQGFNPDHTTPATESDAQQFMTDLHEGIAFLARLDGQPVGAGLYTTPFDGLTEVTGLATLKPFRRRGIATALIALAVQTAFEQEVEVVYLTAADEGAGRVYERVGFRRFATMLAYIEAQHT